MARKRTGTPEEQKKAKSVSRRNFLTHGAVAGVSAAALGSGGPGIGAGDRRK